MSVGYAAGVNGDSLMEKMGKNTRNVACARVSSTSQNLSEYEFARSRKKIERHETNFV